MERSIVRYACRFRRKVFYLPLLIQSFIFLPILLFFTAGVCWGSTNVGGVISTDTTWTLAGSPYIVTSNITVQGTSGADGITTLTIEPGVVVRFNKYTKLQVGASSGSPGALVAQGTSGSCVTFTSNETTPAAGDWLGVQFQDTADDATSVLSNCIVEYAGYGSQGGMYIYSANPRIENTIIRNSSSYGIYIYGAAPTVTGSTITSVANYGLYFAGAAAGTFTGNTIDKGIYLSSGSISTLSGNTFNQNNAFPINIGCDDVAKLVNNNIFNGLDAGSYLNVLGGTITKDAIWPSAIPYRITGNVIVQGTDGADSLTTLTLQPGVSVRFNKYTKLQVGASSGSPGALVAQGASGSCVTFTSNETTPAAGDWLGVQFQDTADDATSILSYCVVEYSGYSSQGGVYIYSANPRIENTIIRNSSSYGIYIYGAAPIVTGSTITSVANYGLYFAGAAAGTFTGNTIDKGIYLSSGSITTLSGNTFNQNNAFPINIGCDDVAKLVNNNIFNGLDAGSYLNVLGGTITKDAIWPSAIPYRITGSVTVQGTDGTDGITTLTIQPGVVVRFNKYTKLQVGASSGSPGALVAQGTSGSCVTFTSNETTPAAGDWLGVQFQDTADDATSVLSNCIVEYAGYGSQGGVYIYSANPRIENTIIRNSSSYGIYIYGAAPTVTGSTITSVANYGLYFAGAAAGTFTGNTIDKGFYLSSGSVATLSGNTFNWSNGYPVNIGCDDVARLVSGNTFSGLDSASYLYVLGGTITKDAVWSALIPYRITGSITVQGADGADGVTTLTIQSGVTVRFNKYAKLQIGSSSGNPGKLLAQGTADDFIAFTSNEAAPAAGDWYGVHFQNTADDTSALSHCLIEYAGYGNQGAVYLYNAKPSISRCIIRNNQDKGIYLNGTGCNDADIRCSTFQNNAYGLYTTANATPSVLYNNFTGNTSYGLYNASSVSVTAEHNWWGSASGPNAGGDKTYGTVDADSWSTAVNDCDAQVVNQPPNTPSDPIPSDGAVRVSQTSGVALSWTGSDPNIQDMVTYDFYWGLSADSLGLLVQNLSDNTYTVSSASRGTTYYWRVVSKDDKGAETQGPVWHFTTVGDSPDLIVSAASTSPAGHIQSGQSVTFTATVRNNSGGPVVDAFTVDFKVDGASIGTVAVNQILLVGESIQVTQVWTSTIMDYNIMVVADSQSQVSESNESNNSYAASLSVIADNTAPVLTSSYPSDGAYLKQVRQISAALVDNQSAVDDVAVAASFRVNNTEGQPIPGSVTEINNTFTFIPSVLPLPDGTYQATLTATDLYGNAQEMNFAFIVDSVPPGKPLITGGAVASGTIQARPAQNNSNQFVVTLTGIREPYTSVWINGAQAIANGSSNWSLPITLAAGNNIYEIWLVDLADNKSDSAWVDIALFSGESILYDYDAGGRLKGIR